jgi:hypothetical protein
MLSRVKFNNFPPTMTNMFKMNDCTMTKSPLVPLTLRCSCTSMMAGCDVTSQCSSPTVVAAGFQLALCQHESLKGAVYVITYIYIFN